MNTSDLVLEDARQFLAKYETRRRPISSRDQCQFYVFSTLLEIVRQRDGSIRECHEVEQILGKALGYPWYKDDPKNFPEATEADGVCVGEHIPGSLAAEAADRIAALVTERDSWQQKWFEQQGEIKTLRTQVKLLKPFQEAYDDLCGDDLVLEQQERAQRAESRVVELETEIARLKECAAHTEPRVIRTQVSNGHLVVTAPHLPEKNEHEMAEVIGEYLSALMETLHSVAENIQMNGGTIE